LQDITPERLASEVSVSLSSMPELNIDGKVATI
jgi:hypothetical protein